MPELEVLGRSRLAPQDWFEIVFVGDRQQPADFLSVGVAARLEVGFPRVSTSTTLQISFTTSVPTLATVASEFPVFYDDTTTSSPEQGATRGDANGIADGDNWQVQVLPGPLARLDVSPKAVLLAQA